MLADQLGGEHLRDHIVHVETATPLSQERYTRSTGGTSYGYVHSPEQSGTNRPQHRTEIDGLWLVGANTASGHGVAGTMVGGVTCAGEILDRPLLVEMMLGTVLADPAIDPTGPRRLRPDGAEPGPTAARTAGPRAATPGPGPGPDPLRGAGQLLREANTS